MILDGNVLKSTLKKEQILSDLVQLANILGLEKPFGEGEHSFLLVRCK